MVSNATQTDTIKNTSYTVVMPFYMYGAVAFLTATLILFFSTESFTQHYFNPHTLAITHAMALGWGTMIILGASHQLVPVLIEGKLYSERLAMLSFVLAGVGIPLLVYAFYYFNLGWPARWGGILINAAILAFLVNTGLSILKSQKENVHAVFIYSAVVWLLITTVLGLVLVYNFSYPLLSKESLNYLPLHAHMGIVGWFLLMIMGVGSRLIPLFLISKYTNVPLLWCIFSLVNGGLLLFVASFMFFPITGLYWLASAAVLFAILLFAYFCFQSFKLRIRKQVDGQIKISLLSVLMTIIPLAALIAIIGFSGSFSNNNQVVSAYGFTIFFGWITAIILGMTFKTLPFIAWNKVYHAKAGLGQAPNPKDLFSSKLFSVMAVSYLLGFAGFSTGILLANTIVLKIAAIILLLTAVLYNLNVFKVVTHQPKKQ